MSYAFFNACTWLICEVDALLIFLLPYKLFNNIFKCDVVSILLSALAICLFPLNYFFQFLFYTDVGSTFLVLLAYYSQLRCRYKLSALSGALSIFFRQTNVVWVVFCLALTILQNSKDLINNTDLKKSLVHNNDSSYMVTNQRKKRSNLIDFITKTPQEFFFNKDFDISKFLHKLYAEDFWGKKLIYSDFYYILDMTSLKPFLAVVTAFCSFLYVNKGIVVGDRSNHEASLHLTQLFYFFSFAFYFTLPHLIFNIKKIKNLLTFLQQNSKLISLGVLPLLVVIVSNFTLEHPFLLADNRHFTFYIWSRIFKRHEFVAFALTPIYLISIYMFYRNLTLTRKTTGWLVAFTACIFVSVVPQKLLEFRYFIVPYYIYRLNLSQYSLKETLLELVMSLAINFATVYLFLNKTFFWPDLPNEPQRFMW